MESVTNYERLIALTKERMLFLEASQQRFKEISDYPSALTSIRYQISLNAQLARYEMEIEAIDPQVKCNACKQLFPHDSLTSTDYGLLCEVDYIDYIDEMIID